MNGTPTECQPIKDTLDSLKEERLDLQGTSRADVGEVLWRQAQARIAELNREIAAVQMQLTSCLAQASRPPITGIDIITGVETTQAIQFFRPAVQINRPAEICGVRRNLQPENDIPLIAGKAVIIRVYVDPQGTGISNLSGVLETRAAGNSAWHLPLTPLNAPIPARASIDRRIADHTLNFRIPPARCQGFLETRVTVFDAAHPGETGFTSRPVNRILQFRNIAPLEIRLVRIRYQNAARNLDLPAPTLEDFWRTAEFMLKTYPIPGIEIVRDSEALYDGDFTDISPSGNVPGSGNWGTTGSLYHILNPLVIAEGFHPCVKYLALVPGLANQSRNSGWAVGRTAIANVFAGPTLAQEIGHLCGRAHAPCGFPPGPDPCYPVYGSFPSASIGEIGFDPVTSDVFDPASVRDFMSYCGSVWVSPYTYEALMGCCVGSGSSGGAVEIEPAEILPVPRELLHLAFTVYRDGIVALRLPGFHLAGLPPVVSGESTPYFVELHDKEGRILKAKRINNQDKHTSLDDAYVDFTVALPWHEAAETVVFKRENEVLKSVAIENATPVVKLDAPFGDKPMTGPQAISWSVESPNESLIFIVRYSNDEGRTWHAVATGITVKEWKLDFDKLPGGDKCVIQVLASAGFRTGKATSEPFAVARKPYKPSIISPSNEATFVEGNSVRFFGFAHSPEGSAKPAALDWSSNRDGFLDSGAEAVVHTLSVGRHRITLTTNDGCGDEASACINITVRPREAVRT